jgi:hypothetical protein
VSQDVILSLKAVFSSIRAPTDSAEEPEFEGARPDSSEILPRSVAGLPKKTKKQSLPRLIPAYSFGSLSLTRLITVSAGRSAELSRSAIYPH